jgi:hypothetical protein
MLRVLLAAPPAPDRADAWVRYAADGRAVARGSDVPDRWPSDAHLQVVLAADQVRLAALDLPAMPRDRLLQAARFALEDQMASATGEAAIAVARSDAHHPVIAAIASDALIRAVTAHPRRVARIVPESALAPHDDDGWTWCESATGSGFVRRADGSAFAVSAARDGELPAELVSALAQSKRTGAAPAAIRAAVPGDEARLAAWSQATGVRFVSAPRWHWTQASTEIFAAAPDFLQRDAATATGGEPSRARAYRPALVLATLAACLAVAGVLGQWAALTFTDWRLSRALVREATNAGLADVTTPEGAAAAVNRRYAELRHRASQSAPGDALPLLARAAPSLAALPRGSLKSATYANDAWTIELGKLDASSVSATARALGRAGVSAVSAPTAGGVRMRLTLDATAR